MSIKYYHDLVQGSEEWLRVRLGIITASQMKSIVTTTGKIADNNDSRKIVFQKVAERLTGEIEQTVSNHHMERGNTFEPFACDYYAKHKAPVQECGFVTREGKDGLIIGYSPDRLVGDDGLLEVKCPDLHKHVKEICLDTPPDEYIMQIQTGLFVTKRKWCDYMAYYNGMEPRIIRVYPDTKIQGWIIDAVKNLEECIVKNLELFKQNIKGVPKADYIQEIMI